MIRELNTATNCRFVNEIVAKRKLPPSAQATMPRVVMKMDIEVLYAKLCGRI